MAFELLASWEDAGTMDKIWALAIRPAAALRSPKRFILREKFGFVLKSTVKTRGVRWLRNPLY
jgi:hypothetical protein